MRLEWRKSTGRMWCCRCRMCESTWVEVGMREHKRKWVQRAARRRCEVRGGWRWTAERGLTSDTKNHKIQAISWRMFEEHRAEGVVTGSARTESLFSGQTNIYNYWMHRCYIHAYQRMNLTDLKYSLTFSNLMFNISNFLLNISPTFGIIVIFTTRDTDGSEWTWIVLAMCSGQNLSHFAP